MRVVDLLATAVANTFHARLRTALTVVAILIGAFTLTLTSAVGTGVSAYITTQVAALGASDALLVTKSASVTAATGSGPQRYRPGSAPQSGPIGGGGGPSVPQLSASDITTIRGIDGIASVTPNATVTPSWIGTPGHGRWQLSVNGVRLRHADLAAGKQLPAGGTAREVLIPTTYVHDLGLGSSPSAVGRTVTIGIRDYLGVMRHVTATIAGVQNTTLLSSGVAVSDALRAELARVARRGAPSTVPTTYLSAVATTASSATPAQVDAVKRRLSAAGFTGRTVADQLGSVLAVINGIVGILDGFAVIALLAAGFGIVNTLLISVQERTREIGLMKAMGMGAGRIFVLFSLEAVLLGLLGSVLGAVLAIAVGTVLSARLGATLLSGLPGLHLLSFSPVAVVVIVLVVMLIGFLAGTLPARRAARQDPIEALRYE